MKNYLKYGAFIFLVALNTLIVKAQKFESPGVVAVEKGLFVYAGGELPKHAYYTIERKADDERKFVAIARLTAPESLAVLHNRGSQASQSFTNLIPLTGNNEKRILNYIQNNVSDDSLYRAENLPIIAIASGTAYLDTLIKKDKRYQYKISFYKNGATVFQKELATIQNKVLTNLPKPETLSSDIVNDAVYLEWLIPNKKDMVIFNVYRAYFGTTDFKKIKTKKGYADSGDGLHLIAIDSSTEKSSLYKYYIQPVDLYGNTSEISEIITAGKLEEAPINPVLNLQSSALPDHKIKLVWKIDTSKIITNIQVFRSKDYDQDYVSIVNLPPETREYIDILPEASENSYYYLVISGGTGQEFMSSKIAAMIKADSNILPSPEDLQGRGITKGTEIKWLYDEPYTNGFYIYRALSGTDRFYQVSNLIPFDNRSDYYTFKDTDKNLKPGEPYRYTIRPENDAYILGKASDTVEVIPGLKTTIEAPQKLRSVLRNGILELYWEDLSQSETNLLGYKIYRRDTDNGPWKIMPNDTLKYYKNYFYDNTVKAGENYSYKIAAIDIFGSESNAGNTVTVAIEKQNDQISVPNPPLLFKNSKGIRISWNQLASQNIQKIKIYRSSDNLKSILLETISADAENYFDSSIEKGKLYYYKISFINDNGKEGNTSREVSIKY